MSYQHRQGTRYADTDALPGLYPETRLRVAVSRLLDPTPNELLETLQGLPSTPERQRHAGHPAEAGTIEMARV
ncbi:hypothetical protein SGMN_35910 [Stenotrophomonas geniculata]